MKNKKKLNWKICVTALAAGLLFALISYFGFFSHLEYWFGDIMLQYDHKTELPIHIIGIDDKFIADMGQQPQYWSRDVYTNILDKLHYYDDNGELQGPAVVGFDILFTGEKEAESDQRFADTCEKYGDVLVAALMNFEDDTQFDESGRLTSVKGGKPSWVDVPYAALGNVTKWGLTNNDIASNQSARYTVLYYDLNGIRYESFALMALRMYYDYIGREVPEYVHDRNTTLFTYSGEPNSGAIEVTKLSQLMSGELGPEIFADEIVLIGMYSKGYADDFLVPAFLKTSSGENKFDKNMYGVEIHANSMEAIAQNKIQVEADKYLVALVCGLLTAIMIMVVYLTSLPVAGAITAGAIALYLIVVKIVYSNGYYFKITYFVIPALLAYLVAIVMHYLSAKAARDKINNAFKMYVAPEIVDEMASDGKFEMKLGGQTKDIAVLFIDIRGFTTMSEKLEPEEVVSILNEYFGLVTDAIFKNKGTIDKFVGDAAMAVFNSPNDLDDYVYRAVHTGWDILLGTQDLLEKLEATHHRTIGFGIGVNCGPATVGNIGSSFRMDYTAIGDTVNTSARLEANAAAGQILISQDVLDRVSEWVEVEKVEGIKLKGKSNEFNIYNITKVIDKPGYLETGISKKHGGK